MDVLLVQQRAVEEHSKYISSSPGLLDPQARPVVECAWSLFGGRVPSSHELQAMRLVADGRDAVVAVDPGDVAAPAGLAVALHGLLNVPAHEEVDAWAVAVCPSSASVEQHVEWLRSCERNHLDRTGSGFPVSLHACDAAPAQVLSQQAGTGSRRLLLTDAATLDRWLLGLAGTAWREALAARLRFLLVEDLDGLQGRPGADLALLVRRLQARGAWPLVCIGSSFALGRTGASPGLTTQVAVRASVLFGRPFDVGQVAAAPAGRPASVGTTPAALHELTGTDTLEESAYPAPEGFDHQSLRTHLHAIAVSEAGLPELLQMPALQQLVQADRRELLLKPEIRVRLAPGQEVRVRIRAVLLRTVESLPPQLQAAGWFDEAWVERTLDALPERLDRALEVWRKLYRSAQGALEQATLQVDGGLLRPSSPACRRAQRTRAEALHQLALLRNELEEAVVSDFEPSRYLAAEGLLPAHRHDLHPLRLFLSSAHTGGEFISRPRAVALREFGPLALLHHAGRRYRVTGVVAPDIEAGLGQAKLSRGAGCFLDGDQRHSEFCPVSGMSLADHGACERLRDLLELSVARAEEVEPGADAQERGFDIATFLGIGTGDLERSVAAELRSGAQTLMRLRFVPDARVVQVNRGWRGEPQEGFTIGLAGGDWLAATPPAEQGYRRVRPWTWHRADALHLLPAPALRLGRAGTIALQQVLHQAIEQRLRLAPGELAMAVAGEGDAPGVLLYGNVAGRPGVLSCLVTQAGAFNAVLAQARAQCRHDRQAIRDALERWAACTVVRDTGTVNTTYENLYVHLLRQLGPESCIQRRFIDFLYARGLRLPDAARQRVDGLYVQPDFHYAPSTWVFCEGAAHDGLAMQEQGITQRESLWARGDEVWTWHPHEDLAERVAERPDLFGKVR